MAEAYIRTKAGYCVEVRREPSGLTQVYEQRAGNRFPLPVAGVDNLSLEDAWLVAWSQLSGLRPFTILRRVNGRYRPSVLSFVPMARDVESIKGRNGRYTVKYS